MEPILSPSPIAPQSMDCVRCVIVHPYQSLRED